MADQRQQGVPDPRAAVRVGTFERVMEEFNREQGMKVAAVLAKYDADMVQPRIAELRMEIEWARWNAWWWSATLASCGAGLFARPLLPWSVALWLFVLAVNPAAMPWWRRLWRRG